MPAITASAPGKAILFGEHAVVYSQPAVAIPVTQIHTKAYIFPRIADPSGEIHIESPTIDLNAKLSSLPENHPIRLLFTLLTAELGIKKLPAFHLKITSTIPVAAGLGSGAATSVAVIRAISTFLGSPLSNDRVSAIAYEIEKTYHGNPSGIDNTVITYAQPLFFIREQPFELLQVRYPLMFLIADSGVKSSTSKVVAQVRAGWQKEPERYQRIFAAIGEISRAGRSEIQLGSHQTIGELMNKNHQYLQEISISCPEIDRLVSAALSAGAYGAKVSGAGQGGNMIALVPQEQQDDIAVALQKAGAVRIMTTRLTSFS
ncbi:MAG: mevalonate kinase [Anaerolineae bacterium]|nr:mevalonate kinase [Anaerolineae bacterium]